MTWQLLTINRSMAVSGYPDIIKEDCYGLQPGDRVTQIGDYNKNGKETSSCRVWKLKPPLTYAGTWQIPEPVDEWEKSKQALFMIHESLTYQWADLFNTPIPFYFLFSITEFNQLWQVKPQLNNIFIYKAKFILANRDKKGQPASTCSVGFSGGRLPHPKT